MSAVLPARPATFSSTGYHDGLGRRTLVFDRAEGATCERLVLRPELGTFETHLRARLARLARAEGDRLARPRRVHRDVAGGPLLVDTQLPPGERLSDLLAAAADIPDIMAGGVDLAIGFLLDIFPALDALHRQAGFAHGAIAPGRLLLTHAGEIVLLDAIYGEALGRLGWSRDRLWQELELAVPPGTGPTSFTPATDILHASLTALVLLLGRPLRRGEYPEGLPAVQAEAVEIAEIRGGGEFAVEFGAFLDRALDPGGTEAFISAREAAHSLHQIADGAMGASSCHGALRAFADAVATSPAVAPPSPAPRPRLAAIAPPAIEPPPPPPPMELRIEIPAAPPPPAASATPAHPPAGETVTPSPPVAEAPIEPPALAEPARALPAQPAPVPAPPPEAPAPAAPAPEPPAVVHATPPPAAKEPLSEPAAPPPADSARRRKRGRKRADGLRSKADAGTAKQEERKAPLVNVPPLVAAPPPPPPPPPQPVFPAAAYGVPTHGAPSYGGAPAPASPYGTPTSAAGGYGTPAASSPAFAPVQPSAYAAGSWNVPLPPQASGSGPEIEQTPMATIALKPAGTIQVKKPDSMARAAQRIAPPGPRVVPAPRFEVGPPARGRAPWKLAAAAAVVIAAALTGRAYLTGGAPIPLAPAPAAAVIPEPAAARGSLIITSTPQGARVLLDGQAVGQTPLTLDDVVPGRRVVSVVSDQGTVRRTVLVEAGRNAEVDVTVFSGWLAVDAPIVLEVAMNGRAVGTTEQTRLMLPPGRHTLSLRNADLGYRTTQVVNIEPGEESRLSLTPTTPINLNAVPWAEVWVDGKRIGETPIANVKILLGTRDIVFRHPEFGERRLTPTIKAGDPAAISVDLTRPGS